MDDDKDGREFSRSVVFAFFEQAEQNVCQDGRRPVSQRVENI